MESEIYVFLITREIDGSIFSVCVDSWDTVVSVLSGITGTDDKVRIVRYKVCSK